jgi:hypothetical protein
MSGVAPNFDALEMVRGSLAALSYVSPTASRDVHVARLRDKFDKAGIAESMQEALGTMQLLREAESLDGGYWTPAPTRAVALSDQTCLLVGVQPTLELRRHFEGVRRAGSGRVVAATCAARLPRQSIESWSGADGRGAKAWAQISMEAAVDQLVPSVAADGLETFGARLFEGRGARRNEPTWLPAGDSGACAWGGVGLYRARTGGARHRYFFGKYEKSYGLFEGPLAKDSLRVQYGLAALLGRPLTIVISSGQGAARIVLPLGAPLPVRRLLMALCAAEPKSFGRRWTCCEPELLPTLRASLEDLGCETFDHE